MNENIATLIAEVDEDGTLAEVRKALDGGTDPLVVVEDLREGMSVVGERFEARDYYLPDLILSADIFNQALALIEPLLGGAGAASKKPVVIGTVQGDVHDIGKNIIKLMFDVGGFTVHDLGRDVPLENFVEEQFRTDSEIVAMSAMMTTTMMGMKKVIELIKEKNPNVAIMLGGAPVTKDVADLFGADGYAESAGNAVQEAIKMISRLREMQNK